jgi:hypothetical protein
VFGDKTFGALLIQGSQEALAYERGQLTAATRVHVITTRDVCALDDPSRRLLELAEEFPEALLGKVHGIR